MGDGEMWHPQDNQRPGYPNYVDRIIIPSNVSCDRCTLAWRWDAHYDCSWYCNSTAPTPPTTGGQCCYTSGCSSCNGAGEWCSSSASACEGSCGGTYCSQRSSPGRNAFLRAVTKHLHSSV